MFFNLFDVWVCFIDFGLMTQQDGRIVKKRIGTVDLSKNQKLESVNWKIKEKCFIFIKLDCHFDEIRFDRIKFHPGDVNGITWVMGKTLAISQTENRRENYWTSSNQRKCSGKKTYFFCKKSPNFYSKWPFSKMSDKKVILEHGNFRTFSYQKSGIFELLFSQIIYFMDDLIYCLVTVFILRIWIVCPIESQEKEINSQQS